MLKGLSPDYNSPAGAFSLKKHSNHLRTLSNDLNMGNGSMVAQTKERVKELEQAAMIEVFKRTRQRKAISIINSPETRNWVERNPYEVKDQRSEKNLI